ncbi:MAG: rRNA maturation RNase YbeY [Chloroflexi bacterium RBG_16_58_14]|nr:MAG: rRNA maturation RNase YbeY [Chloroflexi bacterium RBG_16_58_14]
MIHLQVSESISKSVPIAPENLSDLERAGLQTLQQVGVQLLDLTIVITDDAELHELNRRFLGIDAPTDVLSFPTDETDPDSGVRYLGDILISYPRASAQASAGNHPIQDELRLLVVHGVLHLLGYDHAEPDEQARMWELQEEVLKQLGSRVTLPRE